MPKDATVEPAVNVFHAGHGPHTATTPPATTNIPTTFTIQMGRRMPTNARRAISTRTRNPTIAIASASAMKIALKVI